MAQCSAHGQDKRQPNSSARDLGFFRFFLQIVTMNGFNIILEGAQKNLKNHNFRNQGGYPERDGEDKEDEVGSPEILLSNVGCFWKCQIRKIMNL